MLGFFLLSMTTYLWMLRTQKCCGALFTDLNKQVFLIYAKDLLYENDLSSIVSLMGSFP